MSSWIKQIWKKINQTNIYILWDNLHNIGLYYFANLILIKIHHQEIFYFSKRMLKIKLDSLLLKQVSNLINLLVLET